MKPKAASASPRYLRIQDVRALRHMFFTTRRPVAGLYAGRHPSLQRGRSVEFNDYREYTPGDAPGDVDWKVFGRMERLVVKVFEQQSDMAVSLMIDGSASMAYRGLPERNLLPGRGIDERPSKYDQACFLAAAIGFLTIKQQDNVCFAVARDGLDAYHPAHGSHPHLRSILAAMEKSIPRPHRESRLDQALVAFARRITRKGVVILFSDLMDDMDGILRSLSMFMHRGNDVIVFHVLHPHELELPPLAETLFVDSETGEELRLDTEAARFLYQARLRRYLDLWTTAFRQRGIDYTRVRTDEPFQKALEGYLFRRTVMK